MRVVYVGHRTIINLFVPAVSIFSDVGRNASRPECGVTAYGIAISTASQQAPNAISGVIPVNSGDSGSRSSTPMVACSYWNSC